MVTHTNFSLGGDKIINHEQPFLLEQAFIQTLDTKFVGNQLIGKALKAVHNIVV